MQVTTEITQNYVYCYLFIARYTNIVNHFLMRVLSITDLIALRAECRRFFSQPLFLLEIDAILEEQGGLEPPPESTFSSSYPHSELTSLRRKLCQDIFDPVTSLKSTHAFRAAKSRQLKKTAMGQRRVPDFAEWYFVIWSNVSTPLFELL